jgi:hypothetical protein
MASVGIIGVSSYLVVGIIGVGSFFVEEDYWCRFFFR